SFGLAMDVVDCSSSKRASVTRAKEKASPKVVGLALNSSIYVKVYQFVKAEDMLYMISVQDLVMRLELARTLEDSDDRSIVTCGADG
ncbi:hypothetical protein Tco_0878716, partial [Tanacetum coccineum]